MSIRKVNKQINKKKKNYFILSAFIAIVAVIVLAAVILTGENSTQYEKIGSLNSKNNQSIENPSYETANTVNDTLKESGVIIKKSEVSNEAVFYPYLAGDTYMEVIAVRASDGSVRTALNTCQVCNGSGRGYYVQDDDVLVCQNCGNRFTVDQIEVVKGGCNPVPVSDENKILGEETITIPDEFMTNNKELFINWKI